MLSRRTVWSAPVIVVAAAAPQVAASPQNTVSISNARKCPGNSDVPGGFPKHGYTMEVYSSVDQIHVVQVVTGNGKEAEVVLFEPISDNRWELVVDAASSPSTIVVTLSVAGVNSQHLVATAPHC